MSPAPATSVAWEIAIARSWRKLAVTGTCALAMASLVWQVAHPAILYELVFRPDAISPDSEPARQALYPLVAVAALLAAVVGALVLRRARRGQSEFPLHREVLLTSLMALPVLRAPSVEFEHVLFTGALVVAISLALGWAVSREVAALRPPGDLSARQTKMLVLAGYLTFVVVIGFLAHWRFITFHAELDDTSWEVGAVSGIVRHGYPTVSVAAYLYDGKPLPAPYFNNHVPLVDYLFAPFYAVYPDARTLLWAQAAFMGAGAFGAYLIGRRWLESRAGGVLAAWLYVLNPSVQCFCLHDIHANILTIPAILLAVGFMEAGRVRLAVVFAVVTAICREEAPVYAACLGLFWMLSGEDRGRFRVGLAVLVFSIGLEAFFSAYLMPHFGGEPRWEHFNLYFDPKRTPASMIGALFLNPLGAAFFSTGDMKLEYLVISLIPMGALALRGWKAAWFALAALLLLVPSGDPGFFCLGMNYSSPLVPAALMMGFAGLRRLWGSRGESAFPHRAGLASYVLATALLCNYLYGNIASKSYKLEYGAPPFRRSNQRDYRDVMGYVDALPPFGPAERALWQLIARVPRKAPVLTSWAINPQLSNRDIALSFDYSGGHPSPEERVRYVVIDKLPVFQTANETQLVRFRGDRRWRVFYENRGGVIFERAGK